MAKKLDEATKLLIDSLPENLQKLATSAIEIGYMSRMDFNAATEADEVKMSFKGGSEGFLIEPIEGDSFLYMVMPMRIK